MDPNDAACKIQRLYRKRRFVAYVFAISARAREKRHVVRELLKTEREYVGNLNELIEIFQKPLEADVTLLPLEEQRFIFPGIRQLLELHNEFVDLLAPRISEWHVTASIGDVLGKFFCRPDLFTSYKPFLSQYEAINRHISERYEENDEFRKFVDSKCSTTMGSGKMYFTSLLITIVQRLPRYSLLLRDLLRYTYPGTTDIETIKAAMDVVQALNEHVNQTTNTVHDWKMKSYRTPHWCCACHGVLAGFGLVGLKCVSCGVSVHPACKSSPKVGLCSTTKKH